MVVFAVLEVINLSGERLAMGLTTTAFFLIVAAGLCACAWGILAQNSLARAPLVLCQLVGLGVAWSFRGMPVVAVLIAITTITTLVGVMHPRSLQALES